MKRWILLLCFFLGLGWAIAHFSGIDRQGTFQSIILNFREEVGEGAIRTQLEAAARQFDLRPRLNSEFSEADHIYIVDGDDKLLQKLRQSDLNAYTQYIEPNYLYSLPEATQVRLPISPLTALDNQANPSPSDREADRSEEQTSDQESAPPADPANPSQASAPQHPAKTADSLAPNDPLYPRQWNLHKINVEGAWQISKGKDVIVAVLDTGISPIADFAKTHFAPGYDFINDTTDATDDYGHGTHVAGTIAQSTNNNFGAAGIAYEATLMPLKVLSVSSSGTVADIAEAVRFAADNGASVINLSMIGHGKSQLLQEAINYAYRKGSVIIAPAGNSNENSVPYPARYRHVIGVAALDSELQKTPYSNYGAGVDISAPGGFIQGEDPSGGIIQNTFDRRMQISTFAPYQGTGIATPHVAGVAALIYATGLTSPDRINTILMRSAHAVDIDPNNAYGAGKLDAAAALLLAKSGAPLQMNFFDYWRDRGYIPSRFWVDETKALTGAQQKLITFGLSVLLALGLLGWRGWRVSLIFGLVWGSCGFFLLRGVYLFDTPQLPLRVLGSALPELGNVLRGERILNPITASCLIPAIFTIAGLLLSPLKPLTGGVGLGVAAVLAMDTVVAPELLGFSDPAMARIFFGVNALLAHTMARLVLVPWGQFFESFRPKLPAFSLPSLPWPQMLRMPARRRSPRSRRRDRSSAESSPQSQRTRSQTARSRRRQPKSASETSQDKQS